jgi:hypothetical protein
VSIQPHVSSTIFCQFLFENKKPPNMPSEHPLFPFLHEHYNQTAWGRTSCGAARRCYCLAQEASGSKKMDHIAFAREMTKYYPRAGCSAKAHYVGITLKAHDVTGT